MTAKLRKIWPLTGFVVLSTMVITLLVSTVLSAFSYHLSGGIITLVVLVGALITIITEGNRIITDQNENEQTPIMTLVWEFVAVVVGGGLTCLLSLNLGLGPVVAASLVGIIAHLEVPKYGVPVYTGAFVGMTSNALLFNRYEVIIASVVAGIVFILARKLFPGVGGKLGTTALIGVTVTGLILGRQFIVTPMFDARTNGLIILVAVIATPLTFYLNCIKGHGPVLASAFVGLLAGLLLPNLLPDYGATLAVVAICASFGGMSNQLRCPHIWMLAEAGLFTGVVFVYSTPLLGGAGGKLGTIAFGSILATHGYLLLYRRFSHHSSHSVP